MTIMMIVIIMPVVMNDHRDDTIVRFMVLQMRLKSPPSPDPPTYQSYWQRAVLYRILYCATYSTVPHTVLGSPQLS